MRLHAESRTVSSGNADALRFYLEAHATFIFPQRCCHPRFHAWGSNLAGRVVHWWWIPLCGTESTTVSMRWGSAWWHCCIRLAGNYMKNCGQAYLATVAFQGSFVSPLKAALDVRPLVEK